VSVTWTETATAQLQAIRDYLARSSPGYAQALAGRAVARTEALDGQPQFGAEVVECGVPPFGRCLNTLTGS
jgi:plasmid stabilization system protein ParE